jgi:type II secretory pathway predicted ATPase ExeA
MDYERFFKLNDDPFSNIPDSRFYYDSPQHSRAVMHLAHVAERMRGLGVLTGEVGTGKTMLARRLLEILREDGRFETALLVLTHGDFSPLWFLRRVGALLDAKEVSDDKTQVSSALARRLMEIHAEGRKAVILIDEANLLRGQAMLEEIRGLLNLELSDARLITFILFGMTEVNQNLLVDVSLNQRVSVKYHLGSLDEDAVKEYVQHRLVVAGREEELFTDTAYQLIARYAQGRPRLINAICDNALMEGCLQEKDLLDASVIQIVANNLGLDDGAEQTAGVAAGAEANDYGF